jgi:hypothetical protein
MSRSGEHYMPRPDGDFSAWASHYNNAVKAWWDARGLDANDLKPLDEALSAWDAAYPAHVAAQAAAEAARQAKDAARAELEKQVRPITNFVQTYFGTTNADRAAMGITVRPPKGTPAQTPTTRPLTIVDELRPSAAPRGEPDESTPTRRARPAGVQRAEVFVALTAPGQPAPPPPSGARSNPGDYRYIGSVTRGETTLSFESDKGGMQAHYLSRWVSTSGATGPWSDTASATVAA